MTEQQIRTLVIQENEGTRKTIENGVKIVQRVFRGITKDFTERDMYQQNICVSD